MSPENNIYSEHPVDINYKKNCTLRENNKIKTIQILSMYLHHLDTLAAHVSDVNYIIWFHYMYMYILIIKKMENAKSAA